MSSRMERKKLRNDICTIPVVEVFEINDGCPICRMYNTVEERIITYIMGDAMMEPDVRIETNKLGFCPEHLNNMMTLRGRLQLALMLESHIKEIDSGIFQPKVFNSSDKKADKCETLTESCFICNKIEWGISRMFETIYRCYENEKTFRDMFNSQTQFCMPHYHRLIKGIDKHKNPKYGKEMKENLTRITHEYLKSLCNDTSKYCSMYDYRNAASKDADWGNSKDSVERTVAFLTGKISK